MRFDISVVLQHTFAFLALTILTTFPSAQAKDGPVFGEDVTLDEIKYSETELKEFKSLLISFKKEEATELKQVIEKYEKAITRESYPELTNLEFNNLKQAIDRIDQDYNQNSLESNPIFWQSFKDFIKIYKNYHLDDSDDSNNVDSTEARDNLVFRYYLEQINFKENSKTVDKILDHIDHLITTESSYEAIPLSEAEVVSIVADYSRLYRKSNTNKIPSDILRLFAFFIYQRIDEQRRRRYFKIRE